MRSEALLEETRRALAQEPKELPAVWLYDSRGSELYEQVTRLPEYYLPGREAEILRKWAPEVADRVRATTLIELGAGAARNIRLLLDAFTGLERFVPFDVSDEAVAANARAVAAAYPGLTVEPVTADFEQGLDSLPWDGSPLVAMLGSTIGNLSPVRRARLLGEIRGAFLVGLDLVKDPARLEAAYNDAGGATERFVRNALTAMNRELGADFDQSRFDYEATWNSEREWMDIGFRARGSFAVQVPALELDLRFTRDEYLRAEVSAKFRRERIAEEAAAAGLRLEAWWTDAARDYAVALLSPA